MSSIGYLVDQVTLPEVGRLGDRRRNPPSPADAVALAMVPAAISGGLHLIYFTIWWVPEFGRFWAHDALLSQFAPLVSAGLSSAGHPLVAAQAERSGLLAAYWLLAGLAIPVLAYTRFWLARLMLWPLCYLAVVAGVVTVLGVAIRGELRDYAFGLLALAAWLITASITTWRSLWVDVDRLPLRPTRLVWLLAAYAVITPISIAVGRWLFAPELRAAAMDVSGGTFALRWSALIAPATLPVYLSGLLIGVLLAIGYLILPPRRTETWVRPLTCLIIATLMLAVVAPWAARTGAARAEQLRTASPVESMSFTCGSWVRQAPGEPAASVVVSGATCQRISSYRGHRAIATRELGDSLAPVRAKTPEGVPIESRIIAARYGSVLAVASTNRVDNRANTVIGVRTDNAASVWIYRCQAGDSLDLRFAGADDRDDVSAGRLTRRGERPLVIIRCPERLVRLDPQTGRLARAR